MEWDNPERPECTNLLNIYLACSGKTREEIAAEVKDMRWGEFKPVLTEAVVNHLKPIQDKYYALMDDQTQLKKVLREGAAASDEVASATLSWAKNAMGFTTLADLE